MYALYDKITKKGITHRATIAEAKADFITHITQDECKEFTDWVKNMQPEELNNFIKSNGFIIIPIEIVKPQTTSVECKKIEPVNTQLTSRIVNEN